MSKNIDQKSEIFKRPYYTPACPSCGQSLTMDEINQQRDDLTPLCYSCQQKVSADAFAPIRTLKCSKCDYRCFTKDKHNIDCGVCKIEGLSVKMKEVDVQKNESDFNPRPWILNIEYYTAGGFDIRSVIETFQLNFNRGAVAKYIFRAGKKPGNSALMDLYKAREHINREISYLESKASSDGSKAS